MSLSSADLAVLAGYLAAIFAVGWLASRRIHSSSDYAVAGRSMRLPLLCGTLIGTTVGAAATMGNAGKAYAAGYAVLYVSLAYVVGYCLMAVIAPRLRAANIDSLPDVLQRCYGPRMRLVGGAVLLLVAIPVVAVQLVACGLIVTAFLPELGLAFTEAVVLAAVIIVIYTLLGGLLAVAYTDLLQVAIMVLGIGLLLPLLLMQDLGGPAALAEVLRPPVAGWLGGLDLAYVLAFFPVFTCMVLIDPSVWQRIAAAHSASDLRPAMLATAAFYGLWSLLVVGLGVIAFHLYPELASPDTAVPQLIVDYMPPLVKGLCLAAIIALSRSTSDSMLLIAGTTASWDILRTLRPETADARLLLVSRVTIVVVGALGVVLALVRLPLFEINFTALGIFVCGLFVPLAGAVLHGRARPATAMAAALAGAAAAAGLQVTQFVGGIDLPLPAMLLGLTASAAAYAACHALLGPVPTSAAAPGD